MKLFCLCLVLFFFNGFKSQSDLDSDGGQFTDSETSSTYDLMNFETFKLVFQKIYSTEDEHTERKVIFEANVKKIIEYNTWAEENGYDSRLGINAHCDRHENEFRSETVEREVMDVLKIEDMPIGRFKRASTPSSWDWRDVSNTINSVENQGNCKADWAFAVKSTIETVYSITNNVDVDLYSAQQLLDCTGNTSGCLGGSVQNAALYALRNGVIQDADYSYSAKRNQNCKKATSTIKPKNLYLLIGTLNTLKTRIYETGPMVINLYASYDFILYKSGLFVDSRCRNPQGLFSLSIIGYGSTSTTDYWILRNSMGTSWGEQGYMRLPIYSDNLYCGVPIQPLWITF